MKYSLWILTFLATALLYSSCKNKKYELSVVSHNFDNEIIQQQNLEFGFNKDLYPDSLLQHWDSTHYIEFTPDVKGMFKWNSSSNLVFSPAEGFAPGTDYTAVITKAIQKHSKKPYTMDDKETFHFHTAPLRISQSHVSWTRSQNMSNVMTQLDLELNYDVKVNDAATHLKLSSNGQPVNFTMLNSGTGKTVSIQFMPLNEKDEETPLKIELLKGVPVLNSKYVSAADTAITESIPSRYNLDVTGITAQHTGMEGIVTVNTSQPVMEDGLKSYITISPAVTDFEVELTDAGFTINSKDFKADQTYEVTVSDKMQGAFGGRLKEDHTEQVSFGKLQPHIQFMNAKGMYLSSQGYKNLALSMVNVPKVEVTVIKVYENNLEFFLRRDKRYGYGYDEDNDDHYSGDYQYYETENLGDTIFHKDYETSKLQGQNAARILHLDFQDKIKDYNGIYVITVASKDHYWIQDSKVLAISDIGLIVKQEQDNMYVFANSIRNTNALSGVKISFVSSTNQRVYSATTDADGMAVFSNISKQAPGFHVGLITAKMNDEFSFVWMDQSKIETSRFDVGGRVPNATGLNAWIYAERNLYRPGETIHASTVVRTESWQLPGEIPVKLKLVMPNGKEFATMRKILNEQGGCETMFNIPPSAPTGTYVLEAYSGNDVLLNSYNFSIEDFMPDRLKSELKIPHEEYNPGDSVTASIQADNLFGTPAANRNYQCQLNMDKADFAPKGFDDYNFTIKNDFMFQTVFREGKTSETGHAAETFNLPTNINDAGMLKGNIMASVFDETGRPVHRYAHFTVYTQPYYVGIKNTSDYVSTKTPYHISMVATDKTGKPVNATAQIVILKKEWHTVIQQSGSSYQYVSQQEIKTITQQNINVNGASGSFAFTPVLSGEYEIRLSLPGRNGFVSQTFYAWGWGDTQYTSFDVSNEGNVDIKPDKETYQMGDNMHLLFTTPFEGKMLVTIERDHLIKHFYLNTHNKSASLDLKADEACLPNVYVTATLFRAMDGNSMPLTVAHGYKPVTIENKRNHLPVTVSMTEKSRSKTKQTITVKTTPGAYVTIAAVDEGILQVKNYKTPDPYEYFYQKVALAVNSFDIYPLLLPEIKTTRSSTGGDVKDDDQALRVNPMFVNRVKNVSFWSGELQANGSGVVKYDIDVPQFSGDIRVMAVAYKDKGFGGADQHMKVADPVIISTALPRFLSPQDEVVMPITLSNTTAKDATATITATVSGPLSVNGSTTQQVHIPANREARVVYNIAAAQAIGAGKVTVTVKALNETFTNETDISIRPAASLQKLTGSGTAPGDKTTDVNISSNFITSTATGHMVVSKSPLVQFSKVLEDLVQYPYGCVEQTTSTAFPQLYYADLVKSVTGAENKDMNPAYNVQQAILKLQSMQMSNGALSYWPDGGYESWWGSIYACHFLIEARKAGYEVNSNTIDRLLQYMKMHLQKRETEIYYYNQNLKKEIAPREVTYSLYVLALAGQPQASTMNYYKGNPTMLSLDSKYMLAAAYALSGQATQARQMLPGSFSGEKANTTFGGSFYSYIRDQALALNSLMDINPNDPQVTALARQLSEYMLHERYLSTQERSFGLLALGKIARQANKTTGTAAVFAGGKSIGTANGQNIFADLKAYLNKPVQVQVKGTGTYYYFWEAKGITADGSYKDEDSYLKVRRSYFDRSGTPINANTFRQNDLVVIRLSLSAQYNGRIDNIAITDMLPAGFEIENTRLTEMPELNWIKNETKAEYMDIRDDRINMFTSITDSVQNFYYMVRAVSPGTYRQGPVQADAMYNGVYHSYNGAGIIKVVEK
ncbi:alpha-2-macroglobulin family protein [Chitinophagaceae bacterium MMS25-I14]